MKNWGKLANKRIIEKTIDALNKKGVITYFVENGKEAKDKVFEILPRNAEVMDMTSVTLEKTGIAKEIQESGRYKSVRNKLSSMDKKTQEREMQRIGIAPEWVIGSVHAVTEEGDILIASASGSQLPAYAYGAGHVIWVVGTHKIVKDINQAMKRVHGYSLPLESERARKAYGVPGSAVNKILIIHNEIQLGRITMIFVNEVLGF